MNGAAHVPADVSGEAPGVVASPKRIAAWLAVAHAGDRFVYASRCSLPSASAGAAMMRTLSKAGAVMLFQQRIGDAQFNFVAVRTQAVIEAESDAANDRVPARAVATPVTAIGEIEDEAAAIDAVLDVVARHARLSRPCPSYAKISTLTGVPAAVMPALFRVMQDNGLVRIEGVRGPTRSVVTIVATGQRTGMVA